MKIVASSDESVLIRDCVDAIALFRGLQRSVPRGIRGISPARSSIMIRFDSRELDHSAIEAWVGSAESRGTASPGRLVEIPTIYDGEDLGDVASLRGISTKEVVEIHSGCEYLAWFLGFVPGFAYLGEVPDWIAAPRRSVPRKSVPTGSVGIAGKQTGVYPRSTPGGWNLIGRTALQMFDPVLGKSMIEPGDRVRFVPL